MTASDVITLVDSYEPNAYPEDTKALWLRECEGKIYSEIFLQQPAGLGWRSELDAYNFKNSELSLPAAHDKIYQRYLQAMIHYANGEYDRYAASMQMFNAAWHELVLWFAGDFDISDRVRNPRITLPIKPDGESRVLLTVPERCALAALRLVVKKPCTGDLETVGNFWTGDPEQTLGTILQDYAAVGSYRLPMVLGDEGGTELGITTSAADGSGEACLTGVLCSAEERFLWSRWKLRLPWA